VASAMACNQVCQRRSRPQIPVSTHTTRGGRTSPFPSISSGRTSRFDKRSPKQISPQKPLRRQNAQNLCEISANSISDLDDLQSKSIVGSLRPEKECNQNRSSLEGS
jgi:hypothetical protein